MDRSYTTYAGADVIDQGERDVTWEEVRELRNQALADSDWRALKDVVLSTPWKEYRQALRDLGGFPSSNEAADGFPEAPVDA
jgi:hypothetical protein